ncbi:MAG: regulatory protein RecX [Prolixibacteraceae bacterium]|jgi:regulatory protein|nr:regulatory protein RecX [Prolixibacteraceae bacterium]
MDDFNTLYSRAASLCSRAEKCSSEIRERLAGWGANEEIAEEILKKLVVERFIDDVRYSVSFVKDKFRFNKWGRIKIAYMLRQKNISSEIIARALTEIDENAYRETLKKLLQGKAKKTTAKNQYDQKAKLLRFAQSHGFEGDLACRVLVSLEKK